MGIIRGHKRYALQDPVTGVVAGGALLGGAMQSRAAGRAADSQERSAREATELQREMFQQTRADQMPWQQAGQNALGAMMEQMGFGVAAVPQQQATTTQAATSASGMSPSEMFAPGKRTLPPPPTNSPQSNSLYQFTARPASGQRPMFAGFQADPGFKFRQQQGNEALNNSFAARGGLLSGDALRAGMEYNQGLASQEYGNYWNRLAGIAGVGQTANNTMATVNQNAANAMGNNAMAAGNARASGYAARGQALGNTINTLANIGGNALMTPQRMTAQPWNGITDYNAAEIW